MLLGASISKAQTVCSAPKTRRILSVSDRVVMIGEL
jgi:hypothetical protein